MQLKTIKSALIMIDVQNDFCLGGSLAVPMGNEVVPIANALQSKFDFIIATQDWHPQDHVSFAINHPGRHPGDFIDVHCVQGKRGAEFHPELDVSRVNKIVYKGENSFIDSYSAFFDNAHLRSTGLADYLHEHGIESIYLLGLATEYCVKYSCLDAVELGFDVHVIIDGCRGIDLQAGDVDKAIEEMHRAGAKIILAKDLVTI
jgi:nicotinamidase/pyrazinamidase